MCDVKMRVIYNKEAPHSLYSYSVTGLAFKNNLQNFITTNSIHKQHQISSIKNFMHNENCLQQISIMHFMVLNTPFKTNDFLLKNIMECTLTKKTKTYTQQKLSDLSK